MVPSSYVFYANPTDQPRILKLLNAFSVVFLNKEGNKLATAKLDTEHAYAINGKVTVPLMLTDGVTYLDENEEEQLAIVAMEQNKPVWVTAIMYLDGQDLTNDQVLAAGDIEGRLNLQFGSSIPLNAAKNENLMYDKVAISAEASHVKADGTELKSSNVTSPIELEYDGQDKKVTVKLNITGSEPNTVSAFFVRSISASQGTRLDAVEFHPGNENGEWVADFYLSRPGTYLLRSVIVDGVEYDLERTVLSNGVETVQTAYPAVQISGLGVGAVDCTTGSVMTADSYMDIPVSVLINADASLMPRQVRAIFKGDDDREYSATLTYDNDRWSGFARIDKSGTYTLTYVVMDGDYQELEATKQHKVTVTLGLSARVSCPNFSTLPQKFNDDATKHDIQIFADNVPENLKIKAAGGISSIKDAEDMLSLGAERLGTSRIVKIVKNEESSGY